MTKPLALFDLDKTMFDGPTYEPLMAAQIDNNLLDMAVVRQTDDIMSRYMADTLGYEDFVREITATWAQGLVGIDAQDIQSCANEFFAKTDRFFGYVKPTIEILKPTHEIVLITGSPQFTANAVAKVFGISKTFSTVFSESDGKFTGQVDSFLATRHDKNDVIRHLTDIHPFEGSYGFGDSEGDIEILRAIQHAVCIRPTEGLRMLAIENGWIVIEDDKELSSHNGLSILNT